VFGPVGDDTDASFRQRHGIQQGKKTFTLFISSLKTHVRHRVGGVGLPAPEGLLWVSSSFGQCLCHLLPSDLRETRTILGVFPTRPSSQLESTSPAKFDFDWPCAQVLREPIFFFFRLLLFVWFLIKGLSFSSCLLCCALLLFGPLLIVERSFFKKSY
jgi:hypothetical protein